MRNLEKMLKAKRLPFNRFSETPMLLFQIDTRNYRQVHHFISFNKRFYGHLRFEQRKKYRKWYFTQTFDVGHIITDLPSPAIFGLE